MQLRGVFSVLPTPFKASGEIDLDSLKRVVDLFLAAKVSGLTALGVTSEASRLTERERSLVTDTILKRTNGSVPVVVGVTAECYRICLEWTRHARRAGAAAIMVSPPRMAKLDPAAVLRHFAELASATDIPIVVQDYPPVCGFTMEPPLLARIVREIPTARTIKLEDPPTPLKTARILEQDVGLPIGILGGLGGVFLLEELLAGSAGVMTGFAYPEVLVGVVERFTSGDVDGAADMFYSYVPLMRFEFQEGIGLAIRKEILRRRGAVAEAATRQPGGKLDPCTSRALDRLLTWFGKKGGSLWT